MERSEVEKKYRWKSEDIYSSDEDWEDSYTQAEKLLDFAAFEGKLKDPDVLKDFFAKQEEASKALERLYLYAHMNHDVDSRVAKYTAMQSRAMALYVKLSSAVAFAEPELTALDEDILESLATDERFKDYDYYFRQLIAGKKHILSAEEEKLLASGGEVYAQFQNIFSMIDNADMRFAEVEAQDGSKIRLTHGSYGVILHGSDR